MSEYVATIAASMAQRGHDVSVLCCSRDCPEADELRDGVTYHFRRVPRLRLGLGRVLGGFHTRDRMESALAVWRELRRLPPVDIVEAADWGAEGFLLALDPAFRLLVNMHSPMLLTQRFNDWPANRDLRLANWLERVAVRRASGISLTSSYLRPVLLECGWVLPADADVVWNPVIAPAGPVHVGRNPPLVVVVGRVEPLKGIELLVRAAAIASKTVAGLRLVFAGGPGGDGSAYLDSMRALAAALEAPCAFAGHLGRDQLQALIAQARAVAVGTRYDTLPIGSLLAMAAGLPVATVPTTGLAEIVRRSGGGQVAVDRSPEALASAIASVTASAATAAEAGERARAFVMARLAPSVIAAQREALYLRFIDAD